MENLEAITGILADESLVRVAEDLRPLVRPAIRISNEESGDDAFAVGASKFGGLPDLPQGVEFPYPIAKVPSPIADDLDAPLSFVAQIRLADAAGVLEDSPLPASGLLSFFYTDFYNGRVLYTPDDVPLIRRAAPRNIETYRTYSATFTPMLLPPFLETCYLGGGRTGTSSAEFPGIVSLTEAEWYAYADLEDLANIANVDHLLGYSQDAQPYAMETSYKTFRLFLFPELRPWDELSPQEKQREHESNLLLLQIEPKDYPMHFGRGGAAYFFMRRVDLLNRDFDKAWAWSQ